jgi:hypothetical protein
MRRPPSFTVDLRVGRALGGIVTLSKRRREAVLLCENFKRPRRPRAT